MFTGHATMCCCNSCALGRGHGEACKARAIPDDVWATMQECLDFAILDFKEEQENPSKKSRTGPASAANDDEEKQSNPDTIEAEEDNAESEHTPSDAEGIIAQITLRKHQQAKRAMVRRNVQDDLIDPTHSSFTDSDDDHYTFSGTGYIRTRRGPGKTRSVTPDFDDGDNSEEELAMDDGSKIKWDRRYKRYRNPEDIGVPLDLEVLRTEDAARKARLRAERVKKIEADWKAEMEAEDARAEQRPKATATRTQPRPPPAPRPPPSPPPPLPPAERPAVKASNSGRPMASKAAPPEKPPIPRPRGSIAGLLAKEKSKASHPKTSVGPKGRAKKATTKSQSAKSSKTGDDPEAKPVSTQGSAYKNMVKKLNVNLHRIAAAKQAASRLHSQGFTDSVHTGSTTRHALQARQPTKDAGLKPRPKKCPRPTCLFQCTNHPSGHCCGKCAAGTGHGQKCEGKLFLPSTEATTTKTIPTDPPPDEPAEKTHTKDTWARPWTEEPKQQDEQQWDDSGWQKDWKSGSWKSNKNWGKSGSWKNRQQSGASSSSSSWHNQEWTQKQDWQQNRDWKEASTATPATDDSEPAPALSMTKKKFPQQW